MGFSWRLRRLCVCLQEWGARQRRLTSFSGDFAMVFSVRRIAGDCSRTYARRKKVDHSFTTELKTAVPAGRGLILRVVDIMKQHLYLLLSRQCTPVMAYSGCAAEDLSSRVWLPRCHRSLCFCVYVRQQRGCMYQSAYFSSIRAHTICEYAGRIRRLWSTRPMRRRLEIVSNHRLLIPDGCD